MSIYANIDNSYSTNGIGTALAPYNWTQFLNDLSASVVTGDRDYAVSGTRILSANQEMTIDSSDTIATGSSTITIEGWGEQPWKILCDSSVDWLRILTKYTRNIVFKDAMIQGQKASSYMSVMADPNVEALPYFTLNNCWVNFDSNLSFTYYHTPRIYNSTVYGVQVYNTTIDSFESYNTIYGECTFFSYPFDNTFDNCIFTNETSAFDLYGTSASYTSCQENWTAPAILSADVSAISASDLDYLSSAFNTISATGNTSITGPEWFSGNRDGVGALYFPEISASTLSADPTSAALGATVSFYIDDVFTSYSASSATFDFGDTENTTVNERSATHVYSATGDFDVTATVLSKNGWYSVDVDDTETVTISAGEASATFQFLDSETSATTMSADTHTDVLMSATIVSGDVVSYTMDWGDGTSSTFITATPVTTIPVLTHQYLSAASISGTLTINDGNSYQQTLEVYFRIPDTYYVNITSAYTSVGTGSTLSPLNYGQFKTYVEDGEAGFGDIFKLRGYRELEYGDEFLTSTIFSADPSMGFVIDAWDLSAYGPWMIVTNIYPPTVVSVVSFKGCVLRNGILYNKPYFDNRGNVFKLSTVKDMFIVNQGTNSRIELAPNMQISATSGCDIIGSTLYAEHGYRDDSDQAYDLNLTDSVFVGFENQSSGTYFTSADVYIYNSTFTDSYSSISADFIVSGTSGCQYDWTQPTNYPFTVGHDGYNQSLTWLLQNKRILMPFSGITYPPNPGKNYDSYPDYESGLFGYLRKDYEG